MHNFVKYVGRQSNSQDFEGDSKILSFTVFFLSTLSNLDQVKGGNFGTDTSVCSSTEKTSDDELSKFISNFIYFVLKSS